MAQIRIKGRLESVYKTRTVIIISAAATVLIVNRYIDAFGGLIIVERFQAFFSQTSLISFYGSIIGLLLAAYAVFVTMIPNFHHESLRQPIFSQVNRLFSFTIIVGIVLMLTTFTVGVSNVEQTRYFTYLMIFLFLSLLVGLIFCVLTLSDMFQILRRRGER